MTRNRLQILSLIALTIGFSLIVGGGMLLLVTLIEPRAKLFSLPAALQIMLGIFAVIGGFQLWRQNSTAKYILLLVAVGVAANLVFLITLFARQISQSIPGGAGISNGPILVVSPEPI